VVEMGGGFVGVGTVVVCDWWGAWVGDEMSEASLAPEAQFIRDLSGEACGINAVVSRVAVVVMATRVGYGVCLQ